MNVYIWTDTPWTVTETYTFSWISGSSQATYNSIAKSWYKVLSVVIEGTWTPNDASAWVYPRITYDTTRAYEWQLTFNIGSNNTWTFSWVRYRDTWWTNIDVYDIRSYVNYTATNTYKMTFNRDWWLLTINWTNLSGTYSSWMKTTIDTIMDSTTIQFRQGVTNASMSTQTVTVTYEQV